MENKIFGYLELALPAHNCVIIPELGGFIVNRDEVVLRSDSSIDVPRTTITFNVNLRHDDGIITSYYTRNEGVSYNVALQKIKDSVKLLKQELSVQKSVTCGKLGVLYMDSEGRMSFEVNQSFIFPDFYGLTPVGLSYLSEIIKKDITPRKSFPLKYVVGSAAAAVAMFLFTIPSVKVHDLVDVQKGVIQQSGFISSLAELRKPLYSVDSVYNMDVEHMTKDVKTISVRTYYIIVGGEDTNNRAERLLGKIKDDGLSKANILESGGRYRIYIASYDDKKEAEEFLEKFREDNPKYKTAWLYSKKN